MVAHLLGVGGAGFTAREEGLYTDPISLVGGEVPLQEITKLGQGHLVGMEAVEQVCGSTRQTDMPASCLQFLDLQL